MKEPAARGRLVRRETHSSRAAASVVTGIVLVLILAWAGTEAVLSMAGAHPLLASPPAILGWLTGLPAATLPAGMIAGGAALALAGLVLVLLALRPGTRGRHTMPGGSGAVVVDDDVIATAIARTARHAARLVPEQVTARVSRRRLEVLIHPTSGVPVDGAAVRAAVESELDRYALVPAPRLTVTISRTGAVGV
ncbi:UNVERIFIED_ORG: hypothetical protein ABIB52_004440 [Arthrobacter sp. UYCu721]